MRYRGAHSRCLLLSIVVLAWLAARPVAVPAQESLTSTTDGIGGFDLVDLSLNFWRADADCSPELDYIRRMPDRSSPTLPVETLRRACGSLDDTSNTTQYGSYIYYFRGRTLRAVHISTIGGAPGERTLPVTFASGEVGSLTSHDGFLYFGWRDPALPGTGAYRIYQCTPEGTGLNIVHSGTGTSSNNHVRQIIVRDFQRGVNMITGIFFIIGAPGPGTLAEKDLGSAILPIQLSDDVVEYQFVENPAGTTNPFIVASRFIAPILTNPDDGNGGGGEGSADDTVDTPARGTLGSYIRIISPLDGSFQDSYTNSGTQVGSVTSDFTNVYWAEYSTNAQIRRKPVSGGTATTIVTQPFGGGTQPFFNVRTDGTWVYYGDRTSPTHHVRRVATNAPAPQLDVIGDNVEAVQTTQILAPTSGRPQVYLHAGKPTVVRAYARLGTNTTGTPAWRVDAQLRVFDDGSEVVEARQYGRATLTADTGAANTRGTLDGNVIFHVPGRFIRPGTMSFTVDFNGDLWAPETATQANNDVTTNVETVRFFGSRPNLILTPVRVQEGTYFLSDMRTPARFFARFLSLIPYDDVGIIQSPGVMQEPDLCDTFPFICMEPFEMPDDKDYILAIQIFNSLFLNLTNGNYQMAMIHPGVSGFNGVAVWLMGGLTRMEDRNAFADNFNFPLGAHTLAHECGHTTFLFHVESNDTCGSHPDGPYASYPWDPCTLGPDEPLAYWGFDPLTRTVIAPTASQDLMAYGNNSWTSNFHWQYWRDVVTLGGVLELGRGPAPTEPDLVIGGIFNTDTGAFQLPAPMTIPTGVLPASTRETLGRVNSTDFFPDQGHRLRQRDAAGSMIRENLYIPTPIGEGDSGNLMVMMAVPFDDRTQAVELVKDDVVMLSVPRSPNAPTLTLGTPEFDAGANTLSLNWTAWDADEDPLLMMVQYSNDNGATWQTAASQYPHMGIELDGDNLGGGVDCVMRVFATDGMNTAMATTAPFTIPNRAPRPMIDEQVGGGNSFPYGVPVDLYGMALDAEDGSLPETGLAWSYTGPLDGAGVGPRLIIDRAAPGTYGVTLDATDSDGLTGSAVSSFEVAPIGIPVAAATPVLDGLRDAVYAASPSVPIIYSDGSSADVRFLVEDGNLWICASGLLRSGLVNGFSLFAVFTDPDFDGGGVSDTNDPAFVVEETGTAIIGVGNGAGSLTFLTNTPADALLVRVTRTTNTWTAEMRVDAAYAASFGFTGHVSGLAVAQDRIGRPGDTLIFWPPDATVGVPDSWVGAFWGGAPPDTPPSEVPIANAGADIDLIGDSAVTIPLDGSLSADPADRPLTFSWTQTAGPTVQLVGADTASPTFVAGPVSATTLYAFELVVSNGINPATDTVDATLRPRPSPLILTVEIIVRHILGIELRPADYNGNGRVDIQDVILFINDPTGPPPVAAPPSTEHDAEIISGRRVEEVGGE